MSSPAVIDFDAILRPISEEKPSGGELREDPALGGLFFEIKDARDSARVAESKRLRESLDDEGEDVAPPDWKVVKELAVTILSDHSKDLWIASWLIESLAREHGFAGLRDGFRATREIAEKFWDSIHPFPDEEDGIAWTVSQLAGLNGVDGEGALIGPINMIPITPQTRSYPPLSSFDHIEAQTLSNTADLDLRASRVEKGAVLPEDFTKMISEATPDQFVEILESISEAKDEFSKLTAFLDEKCGKSDEGYEMSPPSSAISKALEETHSRLRGMTSHLFAADEVDFESDDAAAVAAVAEGGGGTVSTSGGIGNREEAFRTLLRVADFFRRTEPHSPVSYSLEQAVRWGKMSLPELMSDLIGDQNALNEMFKRAGIDPPEGS